MRFDLVVCVHTYSNADGKVVKCVEKESIGSNTLYLIYSSTDLYSIT